MLDGSRLPGGAAPRRSRWGVTCIAGARAISTAGVDTDCLERPCPNVTADVMRLNNALRMYLKPEAPTRSWDQAPGHGEGGRGGGGEPRSLNALIFPMTNTAAGADAAERADPPSPSAVAWLSARLRDSDSQPSSPGVAGKHGVYAPGGAARCSLSPNPRERSPPTHVSRLPAGSFVIFLAIDERFPTKKTH